eukprot:CAMPEP_0176093256 /NCGR_PEP_ID=MMETSP0120_2-20121206/46728_1 /TAXON_ID=160619 /ORGANISM="Kryptoperidinium foliaceum, Strain CCMP 1326" /LENGTH=108 /DNA_ID=CAMNT_0017427189 /DNA_START=234 /DNA_END=557 /DNA_ORIENTATION=-
MVAPGLSSDSRGLWTGEWGQGIGICGNFIVWISARNHGLSPEAFTLNTAKVTWLSGGNPTAILHQPHDLATPDGGVLLAARAPLQQDLARSLMAPHEVGRLAGLAKGR